jgi:hypothetical protein
MHVSRRLRLLGAGLALSLPLLTVVPLVESPALADVTPPSGCVEITDNNGISGFGLYDNGHNVQAISRRAAECWQFLSPTVLGGHTWYPLKDTQAGLCLDDVRETELPESCPAGDTAEMWRIVGASNNMLQNEASGHFLNAASISNNAVVGSTPNSNPQSTNTWTFTSQSPTMQVVPVLFEDYNAADWTKVANSEPYGAVRAAVIEICDLNGNCGGAATAKNPNWPATISMLGNAGITPLYYIDTNFGSVPLATVEAEAAQAVTWYGDSANDGVGFMFDEVANNDTSYYQSLYNYASSTLGDKLTVMFNAGAPTSTDYIFGPQEILQVFEGSESSFNSATFPDWMTSESASQFSATISGATSATYAGDITTAHNDHIERIFINDETQQFPPYNTLPSFFANETAKAAAVTGP